MVSALGISGEKPYIVFGYGSLIWKFSLPPTQFVKCPGSSKATYADLLRALGITEELPSFRKQIPKNPGRVVTLIHSDDWQQFSSVNDPFPKDDIVWGVAYTIDPAYAEEVKAYLGAFTNEKRLAGYTEETIDVWGVDNGKEEIVVQGATVYVGRVGNVDFVGSEPIDQLARHIWLSEGPSGKNKDYFYSLAQSVRELAPESKDSHLLALEVGMHFSLKDEAGFKTMPPLKSSKFAGSDTCA
ncbi:hypothetical protein FRB97_006433 [Tulasnella sp. 331]|nr:hypothetical protein FRB97_006433 [Tulasnella sp. 331]